jgi:3-methyl-2-oxobutanoate hydroxymethyltransferase
VVRVEVAKAIYERTWLFMLSTGAGQGCDAQYLSADDVLGQNRGHMPRRSKAYRNFAAEYDRLQAERVAAFSKFAADPFSTAYLEERHVLHMDPDHMDPVELGSFMVNIDAG